MHRRMAVGVRELRTRLGSYRRHVRHGRALTLRIGSSLEAVLAAVARWLTAYLLDVNVLVAWGWSDHIAHEPTVTWIATTSEQQASKLLTSAIPELGFVRVSVLRTGGRVTVKEAGRTLEGMLSALGARHVFLPDDRPGSGFPGWCHQASRTTDAHLLRLAEAHGVRLATLDTGIPGAFLVPGSAETR